MTAIEEYKALVAKLEAEADARLATFKATCKYCGEGGLAFRYNYDKRRPYMINRDGHLHACEEGRGPDIRPAECKRCKATDLFWVRKGNDKFELTESYGLPHTCVEGKQFMADWAEAKRINYAFEKAWLKSKKDDSHCGVCVGMGYKTKVSKAKKLMLKYRGPGPFKINVRCKHCKGIGRYTVQAKKYYLKQLRKLYWPYNPALHKWKLMP